MKELIKADVIRTCQEFPYFRKQETKDTLKRLLYIWNAEHDLGYKQGMNEILAIVLIVFDTERSSDVIGCEPEYLQHDVYFFFDALLSQLGVAKLYQETKDISELNSEINPKVNTELFGSEPNFKGKGNRRQLEQAYDREK